MTWVRVYLLAGIVAHKAVWEVLKRRQSTSQAHPPRPSARARFIKGAKVVLLLLVIAQTMSPDIFPILAQPQALRAIGVGVYSLGLAIAVLGRLHLGTNWSDVEAPQIQQQHTVVSTGIYRHIRHPIYIGDLLLLLGLQLSLNSWFVLGVAAITPFVVRRAVREEDMLRVAVPGYGAYCARTKRFVPYVV
jgi:protein-S-isoprenylcysteine O-methyltransferase Ste14